MSAHDDVQVYTINIKGEVHASTASIVHVFMSREEAWRCSAVLQDQLRYMEISGEEQSMEVGLVFYGDVVQLVKSAEPKKTPVDDGHH